MAGMQGEVTRVHDGLSQASRRRKPVLPLLSRERLQVLHDEESLVGASNTDQARVAGKSEGDPRETGHDLLPLDPILKAHPAECATSGVRKSRLASV